MGMCPVDAAVVCGARPIHCPAYLQQRCEQSSFPHRCCISHGDSRCSQNGIDYENDAEMLMLIATGMQMQMQKGRENSDGKTFVCDDNLGGSAMTKTRDQLNGNPICVAQIEGRILPHSDISMNVICLVRHPCAQTVDEFQHLAQSLNHNNDCTSVRPTTCEEACIFQFRTRNIFSEVETN